MVKFSLKKKGREKFSGLFDSKAIEEIYQIIETKLTEDEYMDNKEEAVKRNYFCY